MFDPSNNVKILYSVSGVYIMLNSEVPVLKFIKGMTIALTPTFRIFWSCFQFFGIDRLIHINRMIVPETKTLSTRTAGFHRKLLFSCDVIITDCVFLYFDYSDVIGNLYPVKRYDIFLR